VIAKPFTLPAVLLCLMAGVGFSSMSSIATDEIIVTQQQAGENESAAVDSGVDTAASDYWGKLLPLPIFVTEPAIGEGIGATLIYFHQDEQIGKPGVSTPQDIGRTGERPKPPPVATGIFGFYTNNDTAALGLAHSNTFVDDRFRLRAAAVEARINSDYYVGDRAIGFQLEGNLLFSDLKTRLGNTGAFFGVSASYANASNSFRTGNDKIDGVSLLDLDFIDAGLAVSLIYDTRDNTVMPADGYLLELTRWQYSEDLGGDFDYDTTRLRGLWFRELGANYVLGVRVDASNAGGETPFYAEPYVRLRGIPALRYQGETASAIELEGRYLIADRWSASLFGGLGSVRVDAVRTETDDAIRTIGIGGRYLALREQDAWVGLDIARGPEDLAFYIQIGSSW
jgi:hypothetical protein